MHYLYLFYSKETRKKIGVGVRMRWQKRREHMKIQETCFFEWQNLIAEASRRGYIGEEELQWDSYKILTEKLEVEWMESVEQRKTMSRPKGSKRAPKSPEQRRKIAEAIPAKWADPVSNFRFVFVFVDPLTSFRDCKSIDIQQGNMPSNTQELVQPVLVAVWVIGWLCRLFLKVK